MVNYWDKDVGERLKDEADRRGYQLVALVALLKYIRKCRIFHKYAKGGEERLIMRFGKKRGVRVSVNRNRG